MRTIVLGGGICGLATALMLARDGHDVTVLERDGDPVPDRAEAAWETWQRHGVVQFRQAHYLQSRGRQVLDDELPDVTRALAAAGALRLDPISRMPRGIADRARRPGDERFVTYTGRRTTLELVVARIADAELDVRRGVVVTGVQPGSVGIGSGERLAADLIVDAMGRHSPLPKLLGGARPEPVDSGFLYYTRFFRGRLPELRGTPLTPLGRFSILTVPGDAGTWCITLYASARDRALKRLRHVDHWTELVRSCPRQAHWLDGEPITDVMAMGGVIDRYCSPAPAPGIVSVADAWACTNPSLGRGISLGLAHAALLRRVLREQGVHAFAEATERELAPFYSATVAADRARLAEMDALRTGAPLPPPDPLRAAFGSAIAHDADAYRAALDISNCLALPQDVLARPGLAERVLQLAA